MMFIFGRVRAPVSGFGPHRPFKEVGIALTYTAGPELTKAEEFARGWPVLLASSFGAGVGIGCLLNYTNGIFLKVLEEAIGLTRTQFGLAHLLATLAIAAMLPKMGAIVDRFGVRWPTVIGTVGLSFAYLGLAIFVTSVTSYLLLMICLGLLGSATTSVSFTRAVNSWFDKGRGLALGFTQAGTGMIGTLIPPLIVLAMESYGWRAGYFTVAGIAFLGFFTALFFLRNRQEETVLQSSAGAAAAFGDAVHSRLFWMLFAAFFLMALSFAGISIHFVPIARDLGVSPMAAAGFASLIGISVLASRLVVGWLADMMHAPWLAIGACMFGAIGCMCLSTGNLAFLPLAAILVGSAMGAELDLLGYLVARYFPLQIYGRVYSWQYGGLTVAAGASPLLVGWMADQTGGYHSALIACAGLSPVVMCLFFILPRYSIPRRALKPQEA